MREIDAIRPSVPCKKMWAVTEPNIAERAILDLSVVIHRRAHPDVTSRPSAVSYSAQVIAYSFFEQFGLDETLAEIAKG